MVILLINPDLKVSFITVIAPVVTVPFSLPPGSGPFHSLHWLMNEHGCHSNKCTNVFYSPETVGKKNPCTVVVEKTRSTVVNDVLRSWKCRLPGGSTVSALSSYSSARTNPTHGRLHVSVNEMLKCSSVMLSHFFLEHFVVYLAKFPLKLCWHAAWCAVFDEFGYMKHLRKRWSVNPDGCWEIFISSRRSFQQQNKWQIALGSRHWMHVWRMSAVHIGSSWCTAVPEIRNQGKVRKDECTD